MELWAFITLGLMVFASGCLNLFAYLISSDLQHSVEDIKAELSMQRLNLSELRVETYNQQKQVLDHVDELKEAKAFNDAPAKQGSIRFHIPTTFFTPND